MKKEISNREISEVARLQSERLKSNDLEILQFERGKYQEVIARYKLLLRIDEQILKSIERKIQKLEECELCSGQCGICHYQKGGKS